MLVIFWNSKKSWTKRHGCFQGKHPSTSPQDTFLCSSFTFQPAARPEQSTQISLGYILLLFIKDQIWVFSKYSLPTYLKNINWIKIASGFCGEIGNLRNLIVHSRQNYMDHGESQCCRGDKMSSSAAAPMFCSTHNITNCDLTPMLNLPAQPDASQE